MSKEALKAPPKIAVAVPPKRALRKLLQWEKHKQEIVVSLEPQNFF